MTAFLHRLANDLWQCNQCGTWFHSPTPSQNCGGC